MKDDANREFEIFFLNQMAGPLFRELAEDLAKEWTPSLLYTGHPDSIAHGGTAVLALKQAPEYNRHSLLSRFVSWLAYFFNSCLLVWRQSSDSVLFLVSNPPFLGLIGLFFHWLRGQPYMILVYDIYPDVLLGMKRLKPGFITKGWYLLNKFVYKHAALIFTIGNDMARRLENTYHFSEAAGQQIVCVPCWADVKKIIPLSKEHNWFARKYRLSDKIVILYSGNMGHSHYIEPILELSKRFSTQPELHFLFIGEGAKWALVERTIASYSLTNITLLPFQPEDVLPYSFPAGDIGVVSYQQGTEGCMVPSKAYYYLAAGLALIVLSEEENDLTELVQQRECGLWVHTHDINEFSDAVTTLCNDTERLKHYQRMARQTAETLYSRKNTEYFIDAIKPFMPA